MVRAILENSKTQTRLVVNPAPEADQKLSTVTGSSGFIYAVDSTYSQPWPDVRRMRWDCPYGQPGDLLWVRETFCPIYSQDPNYNGGQPIEHDYRATYKNGDRLGDLLGIKKQWKSSRYMPRRASRITLEITGVRIERLQGISESDAIAEGCSKNHNGYYWGGPHAVSGLKQMATAKSAYNDLWTSINGPDSWAANPWVWVVEFKKVAP